VHYSAASERYRTNAAFRHLEQPDAVVHRHGTEAARLFGMGKMHEALAGIGKVEEASVQVLADLERLRE
jgi:methyl-accepting chemotaxis protein